MIVILIVILTFRILLCIRGLTYHQWRLQAKVKMMAQKDKQLAGTSSRTNIFNRAPVISGPHAANTLKNLEEMSQLSKSEYSKEKMSSIAGVNVDPLKSVQRSLSLFARSEMGSNQRKAEARPTKSSSVLKLSQSMRKPFIAPPLFVPQFTLQPRKSDKTTADEPEKPGDGRANFVKTISLL